MVAATQTSRLSLARWLLAFASSVVALGLAELACRLLVPEPTSMRFQQDVDELDGLALGEASRMIRNDPEVFWKLVPGTRIAEDAWPFFGVIANGQSLREDHDIPLAKPPGELRVLFLGDSCTFGYGVAHDETFVEVITPTLARMTGRPVECINAGVPGYTVFQGYRHLVTEGLSYQPDLVVLTFGWNDLGVWDHLGDLEHYALAKAMQPPGLLRGSRLCQLIWGHWNKPTPARHDQEKRPRLLPSEFRETLDEIHAILKPRGIPLLVLVWPMRANADPATPAHARTALQIEMMEFGKAHPLSKTPPSDGVLDLVPLGRDLVAEHGAGAIYFDHGHVSPLGHRAIAEAIADHLAAWLGK